MRKLVNLGHLEMDLATLAVSMPLGFGDSTRLRTLPAFIVGRRDGLRLTEFQRLGELRGSLHISRLENVSRMEEAKEAALDGKEFLSKLELQWTRSVDGLMLLENLHPHFSLKALHIIGYGGTKFPIWIEDHRFINLEAITLHDCLECELFPSFGRLPSLKCLQISNMPKVKEITQFGRCYTFPRLEILTINGMHALEKWSGIADGDFPCLRNLNISDFSKLTALPELSFLKALKQLEISLCPLLISLSDGGQLPASLQDLIIIDCPLVKERYHEENGQDRERLAHIQNVWIDYERIIIRAEPSSTIGLSPPASQSSKATSPTQSTSNVNMNKDADVDSSILFKPD